MKGMGGGVVLAGPNGCGKSCVLDAIRLLKSVYGGYQANEWHSWFGEFQIDLQRPEQVIRVLQDSSRRLVIRAVFEFADDEKAYLRANAVELARAAVWREVVPELATWRSFGMLPFASQFRVHNDEVDEKTTIAVGELMASLDSATFTAQLVVEPTGVVSSTEPSRVLELAFSNYEPESLGVLDFHSANRQYNRENVGGVNLDVSGVAEQRRQNSLYNFQNKYAGLKSEMASAYVRRVLAERGGGSVVGTGPDLVSSLQELFETFFPGKSFTGPEPTPEGGVIFPVHLADGSTHDLDELSSGEKEVLYGYMRLRNSAPRNSVILLDEPELHLNPRLISGLARFYFNQLVTASNNQLWLISHSDTLLREAVNLDGFEVYHMRRGDRSHPERNQVALIEAGEELERLVIELVGDLAAYRPGSKVVLFEGGGDVEFDVRMACRLFPEFEAAVNPIAAGNKRQVTALHEVLSRIGEGTLSARFYAIRDRDSAINRAEETARAYTWDVYHIENYLLDAEYILRAMTELSRADDMHDVAAVDDALKRCAEDAIGPLIRHRLLTLVNDQLRGALEIGVDPAALSMAEAISERVTGAVGRATDLSTAELSRETLQAAETSIRGELSDQLASGEWRKTFRGRDILSRFSDRHVGGLGYEPFRDLILARMRDDNFQPAGMSAVLAKIMSDQFP